MKEQQMMQTIRNRKRNRGILFLLSVLCLTGILTGLRYLEKTAVRQVFSYVGAAAQIDEKTALEALKNGIDADEDMRDFYQQKGEMLLKEAGYANTGLSYVRKQIISDMLPGIMLILICIAAVLIVLLLMLRKERSETERVKQKYSALLMRTEAAETEYQNRRKQMEVFEENLYHQMKTPLTHLSLKLEELQGMDDTTNHLEAEEWCRIRQTAGEAVRQVKKLSRMITLLLRDHQIDAEKIRYRYELISLADVLETACMEVRDMAGGDGKRICMDMEENTEFIMKGDEFWLTQCFIAVLDNALEHGSPGGEVRISLHQCSGTYVAAVFSEGSCLSAGDRERVFKRYYSAGPSKNHFGIGLHMAQAVIRDHHGQIRLEESSASGSCMGKGERETGQGKPETGQEQSGVVFLMEFPVLYGKDTYLT